jgi:5-methylcytosine-specific restriction endonuclease McrA
MKTCSKCKQEKDPSQFHVKPRMASGLSSWCKSCSKEYRSNQYLKNKEKEKKQHKEWVEANKERRSAQNVAATTAWQKRNREKVAHWKRDNKHRRRQVYNDGSLSFEEWLALCEKFGNKCLKCGSSEVTIDHVVPLSQGGSHSADNVQPLCGRCNSQKHNKTIDYRS